MQPIIKRDRVRMTSAERPHERNRARVDGARASEKSVRLLEEQGQVRAIELTCDCGEVTVIELHYPDPAAERAS